MVPVELDPPAPAEPSLTGVANLVQASRVTATKAIPACSFARLLIAYTLPQPGEYHVSFSAARLSGADPAGCGGPLGECPAATFQYSTTVTLKKSFWSVVVEFAIRPMV